EYAAALKVFKKKKLENEAENLEESIGEMLEKLSEEKSFSGIDRFIGYFYEETASLLDYMSSNTIIYFDEPARIREHCDYIMSEFAQSMKKRIEHGYIMSGQADTIYDYDDIIKKAENFTKILLSGIIYSVKGFKINEIVEFKIKSTPLYRGNIEMLAEEFTYLTKNKYKILFLTGTKMGCEKLRDELVARDIRAEYMQDLETDMVRGIVYIARGSLKSGFEYIDEKFVIMSDDSQGREKKKKRRPAKKKGASLISNFTELKIGDYIVHDIHGIGIFRGIEEVVFEGIKKDYLKIAYQDEGYLYISTDRMDMIQKYIGNEGIKPKVDKLGGTQWAKNKARAKKAAMIQAEELIKIYAKRRDAKGFAYSPDTIWQSEFEDSFIYEETDDQLNAIADVKEDMQSDKAMDRLICGDVGYGKTEVAIRAAFKAVQDGKQVAMLVPTTILAQQHYSTFISRMKDYPINIEMLSRFKTAKQQKETIAKLKKGIVDIVIGTHRLLSKDIEFADLGLLIIDEEQRFGVAHKEKLKMLKENVDALALSATPIPRTLHMSLAGIRDMSILEEPPNERMPIQTYVMQYNEDSVREAIHREMARGGQVYYLHNRVANIDEVAMKVQEIVPEANIGYAHGQMSERELENIMISFMNGEIDVLVCTTIIETGLDIPNVNTIIIQDSDRMGLSQLYQLRGR
ncbi:MAG: DEAD/DEAH box helicase, partial [Firmicutes bacterium]|nr:DEAD/DEAH box helicase [Bacillota bacterium]